MAMTTSSKIGIINKVGEVADTCYVDFDGFPQYVGWILKLYYTNPEKIKELISGGDLPSISKFIGEKHDFHKWNKHDWCTYYKRDHGEDCVDPQRLSPSKFWGDSGEEYNYLFKVETGKWYYRCYGSNRWKVLTDKVCEITKEDKEQAEQEIIEHDKKNQHKDIDKMLDNFLAKF